MEDALGRNILPKYANWEHEDIVADVDSRRLNYSLLATNIELDINTCGLMRTFDSLPGQSFYFYGRRQWNKRAAVGAVAYHRERLFFVKEANDLNWDQFYVVGIDNVEGAKSLLEYEWNFDQHVLLCFGQEKGGIPSEIAEKCNDMVFIEQQGAIKCLNVNVCCGMILWDYWSKFNRKSLSKD